MEYSVLKNDITDQMCANMVQAIADGMGLRKMLATYDVHPSTFFDRVYEIPGMAEKYTHAQRSKTELLVDEIIEIADNEPDANRARVRVDTRKWYASKMNSHKYGDKIDVNVQTVDVSQALLEARQRVKGIILAKAINITDQKSVEHLDSSVNITCQENKSTTKSVEHLDTHVNITGSQDDVDIFS